MHINTALVNWLEKMVMNALNIFEFAIIADKHGLPET
jgi:hypothetical protein